MSAPGVVMPAVIARKMGAEPMEMLSLGIAFEHGARAQGNAGAEFHVAQFVPTRRQSLVEDIGLAQGHAIVDPHSGCDEASGLFG